jgi:hypothetical protein
MAPSWRNGDKQYPLLMRVEERRASRLLRYSYNAHRQGNPSHADESLVSDDGAGTSGYETIQQVRPLDRSGGTKRMKMISR